MTTFFLPQLRPLSALVRQPSKGEFTCHRVQQTLCTASGYRFDQKLELMSRTRKADRRLSRIIELTRQICMVPADDHDDLLRKFELVEVEITDEVIAGPAADCSLAAMIGGIKADVMQLMDGRYPHQKKQQAAQ